MPLHHDAAGEEYDFLQRRLSARPHGAPLSRTEFTALYNCTVRIALSIALRITRCPASAEDVVQESYLKAFAHLHQLNDIRKFRPWHKKIVTNLALRHRDRTGTETLFDGLEGADYIPDPGTGSPLERLEDAEAVTALLDAVNSLPPHHRTMLFLKYDEGLQNAAIATRTGTGNAEQVGQALHRLRVQIRNRIQKTTDDPLS